MSNYSKNKDLLENHVPNVEDSFGLWMQIGHFVQMMEQIRIHSSENRQHQKDLIIHKLGNKLKNFL